MRGPEVISRFLPKTGQKSILGSISRTFWAAGGPEDILGSRDGPGGQELKSEGLGFECAPELYPNPNMVRNEMYNNEIIN